MEPVRTGKTGSQARASGTGNGWNRYGTAKTISQRTSLYGVLLPPETRPPTAAAGVEATPEEVMVLLAAVLAGHMMMIPLVSSPRFVRLVRLLASARMVKVVEDCSAGVRVTMVMPALWYLSSFCESSTIIVDYPSVLFLLVLSNVARTTRSSDRFVYSIVYYVQRREGARSIITQWRLVAKSVKKGRYAHL